MSKPTLKRAWRKLTGRKRDSAAVNPLAGAETPWTTILRSRSVEWSAARKRARKGPKVLLATGNGGFLPGTYGDTVMAVALTLRGANVHFLLCDGVLPGCSQAHISMFSNERQFVEQGPAGRLCQKCYPVGHAVCEPLGLPMHRLGDWLTPIDQQTARRLAWTLPASDLAGLEINGNHIGEQAVATALRYFTKGDLTDEATRDPTLRRFVEGGALTALASERLIRHYAYEAVTVFDGIYVPHGVISQSARLSGSRAVNWHLAYRKHCFVYSHGEPRHTSFLSEPTDIWENTTWNAAMEDVLMQYLGARWSGSQDWIGRSFTREQPASVPTQFDGTLIDYRKPTIGLLTNIAWDAQIWYGNQAFPSMQAWVLETIRYFAARPDLQLVIRIHPAEVTGTLPARQPLLPEILKAIPELPNNVFVIPPESTLDTYATMLQCNVALVYGTKTGLELACYGLPVIVAGEAWVRNKGITHDIVTPDEYFSLLGHLPFAERMTTAATERARRYAFHFYFRRSIPLPFLQATGAWPPYLIQIDNLDELGPGRYPGLDTVCDGILSGNEILYPIEHILAEHTPTTPS